MYVPNRDKVIWPKFFKLEQNLMFGASLTNAQSNLSNEKLLFVKQKQEALMEKLIYLLFYAENVLC